MGNISFTFLRFAEFYFLESTIFVTNFPYTSKTLIFNQAKSFSTICESLSGNLQGERNSSTVQIIILDAKNYRKFPS